MFFAIIASLLASPFALAQNSYLDVELSAPSKDLAFVKTPRSISIMNGNLPNIDKFGRLGANKDVAVPDDWAVYQYPTSGQECYLQAEVQRGVWEIIARGVGENDKSLIDQGLLGIEWTLNMTCYGDGGTNPWMGQKGDEDNKIDPKQNDKTAHNKHMFLAAAARSLRLLKSYKYANANDTADVNALNNKNLQDKVSALAILLFNASYGLAKQTYINDFFNSRISTKKATNQVLLAVNSYHEAAILMHQLSVNGSDEQRKSRELMQIARDRMVSIIGSKVTDFGAATILVQEDGTLPEGLPTGSIPGFDTSYQTFSLDLLGRYFSTLRVNVSFRQQVKAVIDLALDKYFVHIVLPDDLITGKALTYACNNSRTKRSTANFPDTGERIFAWRIDYIDYLTGGKLRKTDKNSKTYGLQTFVNTIDENGEIFNHMTGTENPC